MNELDLKRRDQRFIIALTVAIALVALLVFVFARMNYAFTFWSGGIGDTVQDSANLLTIGTWGQDDDYIPPIDVPPANFDDVVEVLRTRDAHIFHGYRHIHILGHDLNDDVPMIPANIQTYDVLVFKIDTVIYAVQVVGPFDATVLSSWSSLQAGITNSNIALNTGSANFQTGNVYTRAHAPIVHGGNRWLARHDNVTSTPHIGSDWFMISSNWIEQVYPVGSITLFGNERYRKVVASPTPVQPGTTEHWKLIPYVSREAFNVPFWDSQAVWDFHDVVNHHGFHYVSLINGNTDIPGTSASWQQFVRFDPAEVVPWHHIGIGRPWQAGDFVRANVDGQVQHFFNQPGGGGWVPILPNHGQWHSVSNWEDLTGVRPWSATTQYNVAGTLVLYEGLIYRMTSAWAAQGVSPINAPGHWARVLTWEEIQRPTPWTTGLVATGPHLFYVPSSGYRILVAASMNEWSGFNPVTDSRFRHVQEWDATTTYVRIDTIGEGWGNPGRAHVYTLNADGTRQFWQFSNIAGAPTTITGESPGESPFWQPFEFSTTQQIVITEVANRFIVWDRAPHATDDRLPGAPSITNSNWIRRVTPVENTFVFTQMANGLITLWRNNLTAGNISQPGTDASWTQVYFPTGLNFVYTINAVGIYQFWYSGTQISSTPALTSPHWQMLRYELFSTVPNFFYMQSGGGQAIYFEINPGSAWRQVYNAWIGSSEVAASTGGNTMINHWMPQNAFQNGDIVVYEDTETNTFRYFRLRAGVNANLASGISPFSPAGNMFWQPIR